MNLTLVLIVAISLAMDAFAVSVGLGIKHPNYRMRYAFKVAVMFGLFQAVMPVLGWLLGDQFKTIISTYDHWVVFALLALIGIKMIYEGVRGTDECKGSCCKSCESFKVLLFLSLATSIDALAAGFSFAFLQTSILIPALIIGAVTFVLSFIGTSLGYWIGSVLKRGAEILGGSVLFLLGLKILMQHLFTA